MQGRRLLLVAVLGGLLMTSGASAAPSIDWGKLKDFHYDLSTDELFVASGPAWKGKVVPMIASYPLGLVPRWAIDAKHTPQAIWLSTCSVKEQTALFSYTFQAPGPAKEGQLVIASAGFSAPISQVSVTVNGRPIGTTDSAWRSSGYSQITLDATALKAFRYGSNSITVRAVKPAFPATVKACNTADDRTFDKRRVGVAVGLRATFAADVQTDPSVKVETYTLVPDGDRGRKFYVKAASGKKVGVTSSLKLRNAGPAASVAGQMVVEVQVTGSVKVAVLDGSGLAPEGEAPFRECKLEALNPLAYYKITCPYEDLPPSKQVLMKFRWAAGLSDPLPGGFADASVRVSWGVSGVADDGTTNGLASLKLIFCSPTSSDPGCAGAK